MHRWFSLALLVIILMSSWMNGLYHDLDDVKFENEVYKIRHHEYDSILALKNSKIDSLTKLTIKPTPSPVNLPKRITIKKDTINKDTVPVIIINKDTTITIKDTIKWENYYWF